ncbi:unnamed protein product, partial [marine sediment metagenome]
GARAGFTIEFKSADHPERLVGRGIDDLWGDEVQLWPDGTWEDSLRARLMARKGRALFGGTPRGRNRLLHRLWCKGADDEEVNWEAWNFSTFDNPFIDAEEILEARKEMPDFLWQQNILARFLEDAGEVFRNVHECLQPIGADPHKLSADIDYLLGVDLAKHVDYTVIDVGFMSAPDKLEHVHHERFHKVDWPLQKQRIATVAHRYNDADVLIDSTGLGDPIFDDLVRMGLNVEGFDITVKSKNPLIENLIIY